AAKPWAWGSWGISSWTSLTGLAEKLPDTIELALPRLNQAITPTHSRPNKSFADCPSSNILNARCCMWLERNTNKKAEKSSLVHVTDSIEKGSNGPLNQRTSASSVKFVYPDISKMVIYDPRQMPGAVNSSVAAVSGSATKTLDEILKMIPPTLATFIAQLPVVEGDRGGCLGDEMR
ncbi:hypothetical protein Taro_023448, partial [Colocasia esculenta]|nr:hypothetical protein [Colocasia esculenta]